MSKPDDYGPRFLTAKAEATLRSGGVCQFCGRDKGTHGHHWAMKYPEPENLTGDDITLLCPDCHKLATRIRRGSGGHFLRCPTCQTDNVHFDSESFWCDNSHGFRLLQANGVVEIVPDGNLPF